MSTEVKLLNVIFDNASSAGERANAAEILKHRFGMDRDGIVAKYTKDEANGSAGFGGTGGDDFWRGFDMWKQKRDRRVAVELARERDRRNAVERELKSKEELMLALASANTSQAEMIRKLQDAYGVIDPEVPGTEESIAPRNYKFDRKVRAIRPIEDVCTSYGLALTATDYLPDLPIEYPYWKPRRSKVSTTTCPVCGGTLWVNVHYQRWTCLHCDRRFPYRRKRAPEVMGLVEHLTGCSYYNALWFVISTGSMPQRKEPAAPPREKPKVRRTRKTGGQKAPSATPQSS